MKITTFQKDVFEGYKKDQPFHFFLSENMATNTLGEFSDGEDDFVFEIDENLWKRSDPKAWEWSDGYRKLEGKSRLRRRLALGVVMTGDAPATGIASCQTKFFPGDVKDTFVKLL